MRYALPFALACLCLLGCTERRRASDPVVPDGDTVEVVIPEGRSNSANPVRIIEADDEILVPDADLDHTSIQIQGTGPSGQE